MIEASVIICSHNPRARYFSRVLDSLQKQTLPRESWELLLVDNASDPALSSHWDISWHPQSRHIREEELGLAPARRRGMSEAVADLLIFVDDDNVLADDYLCEAIAIKQKWPILGTWGSGTILPEFEQQPVSYLKPYLPCLALRENKSPFWSNDLSCVNATPAGAGMCVRSSVASEYCHRSVSELIQLTGRRGVLLTGHEDYEIAYVGCSLGLGMGVFPELRMTHLIPKERVTDAYLLRLAEGNQVSGGLLGYKWFGLSPPNPFSVKGVLSIVKNVFFAGGFHRKYYLALLRGRIAARRAVAKYDVKLP